MEKDRVPLGLSAKTLYNQQCTRFPKTVVGQQGLEPESVALYFSPSYLLHGSSNKKNYAVTKK